MAGMTQAQNDQISSIIRSSALPVRQPLATRTLNPSSDPKWTVIAKNTGIIRKFLVRVDATLNNTDGATAATLTEFALANLLKNVTVTDYSNTQRINTTGLHLQLVANAKRRLPSFATAGYNTPSGNNTSQSFNVPPALWPVYVAPAAIAANGTATVRGWFEIPLAYSDDDLRGAIFAQTTQSQMTVDLTFNQNAFAGADDIFGVYKGSSGGTFSSATVTVYQDYFDQLPLGTNGYLLPLLDLAYAYELQNSRFTSISANSDYPVSYANNRSFLSTFAIYNNSGATGGRVTGADINNWKLMSANSMQILNVDPLTSATAARDVFNEDLPSGTYYFSHRLRPINTNQYGNIQLVLNANTAGAAAYLEVMFEQMNQLGVVSQAGSLAATAS